MPVGVVPHYKSCLPVWCLTVGYVFWCGASLYAMPVGVVLHYRLKIVSEYDQEIPQSQTADNP